MISPSFSGKSLKFKPFGILATCSESHATNNTMHIAPNFLLLMLIHFGWILCHLVISPSCSDKSLKFKPFGILATCSESHATNNPMHIALKFLLLMSIHFGWILCHLVISPSFSNQLQIPESFCFEVHWGTAGICHPGLWGSPEAL